MAVNQVKFWTQEDVGRWLSSINFGYLVPKFEIAGVDGEVLSVIDDAFINTQLRLNPAEKTAFIGALHIVRNTPSQSNTIPGHRISSTHAPLEQPKSSDRRYKTLQPVSVNSPVHKEPEVLIGPASQLLDDNCRHSGWIRKRGGAHRNWKRRYLVLRLGHLYYYESETSKTPKGYFSIQGYSVETCTEADNIKNRPWSFKLVHENPNQRTYVISTAAKHEMDKWIEQLENELDSFEEHLYDPVATTNDDDDDDEEEPPYEDLDPSYEDINGVYGVPEDDDDPYTHIPTEFGDTLPSTFPRTSPHDFNMSPHHHTLPKKAGSIDAPIIPPRPIETLSLSSTIKEEENPYYLRLIGGSVSIPASKRSALPLMTNIHPRSNTMDAIPEPILPNNNIVTSTSEEDVDPIELEDPYYIRLQGVDDLMPKHCLFGNISRDETERRLTRNPRCGTYLLRAHQDVMFVLSVYTGPGDKCKHFKLYRKELEEGVRYSLSSGKQFPSVPLLLQYFIQENLPTSDVKLSEPYHPDDQ